MKKNSHMHKMPNGRMMKDSDMKGPAKKVAKGKKLSSLKAKKILADGTVRGHKLTSKQKRFMGMIAGGKPNRAKKVSRGARYGGPTMKS